LAKHLTQTDIEAIVSIIYAWKGEALTWDGICEASAPVIGKKPTRQSLNANKLIKEAYKSKKSALKIHGPVTPKPSSLAMAADRIARLQSEIESLKRKNAALSEQFVIWQYNAYKYGMKEHQLNEPLPRIDRERTDSLCL
jgi:FtsZ-binding cell division protein ZapB